MKTLSDNIEVTSRSYYFLLDWNEQDDWKFIAERFNKGRLMDLDLDEYMILWLHATTAEYNKMTVKSDTPFEI